LILFGLQRRSKTKREDTNKEEDKEEVNNAAERKPEPVECGAGYVQKFGDDWLLAAI
jgi:hypothetical protein